MASTTTTKRTDVLGVSATITLSDALALSLQGEDAMNRAAVAAYYVVSVAKAASIREYAAQSGTLSKSAVGRMVHVGAALVTIGTSCTEQDARNVARVLNVLPASDVTKATDGIKGRALAKVYASLATKATATLSERGTRAAQTKGDATKGKGKGDAKGDAKGDTLTIPATPDDAARGALAMLQGALKATRSGKGAPTGDTLSALEDALSALIVATREAGSNRSGRTGAVASA